ncbi:unnamed protein product [Sphagnum jensenii]|uniref:Cytochrome P450 n=1 Tax=Sphagnum jensenii TaxID=128206 RepID=A0ABP1BXY7_9BRYO
MVMIFNRCKTNIMLVLFTRFMPLSLSTQVVCFVVTPVRIKRIMNRQGVKGPQALWLLGNMPDILRLQRAEAEKDMKTGDYDTLSHILPFHTRNCQAYGKRYLWWFGWEPRITLTEPDLIKEVLTNKNGFYSKSKIQNRFVIEVLGKGLVTTTGEEWALHRQIVNPAFHQEKLKAMVGAMVKCASSMADEWEMRVQHDGGCVELEVGDYMRHVTADIIAHTAFGSSYEKGRKVFDQQLVLRNHLGQRALQRFSALPGYSLLPTPLNIQILKTQMTISSSLREIIQSRRDMVNQAKNASHGIDLLGLMLTAASEETALKGGKVQFGMQALIDNCKTFFLAGHETTATLLTWTMMLLASHTTWQESAREEVTRVCGRGNHSIDTDMLSKLKTLNMILNESLRLFSPLAIQTRQALRDAKLGDLDIPKGLSLHFPKPAVHLDPDLWGADVLEFKPERFADGVAKASKHPSAFIPFSLGPRFCVGQGFALEEARSVLAMVLQRFRFHLSPNYRHAPYLQFTVKPKYGVPVMLECL